MTLEKIMEQLLRPIEQVKVDIVAGLARGIREQVQCDSLEYALYEDVVPHSFAQAIDELVEAGIVNHYGYASSGCRIYDLSEDVERAMDEAVQDAAKGVLA